MNALWLAHAVPYPPKAGFLLRSYNLLRELARDNAVDLVAFVQEPWITTMFPTLEAGLAESRAALGEFCRSVQFLPIDNLRRPAGKQLTAVGALLRGSSYTTSWLSSQAARGAIAQQIGSNSYDLVHFDTIGLACYRDLAGALPSTLTHHNIESHMMLRRAEHARNPLARAYFAHEARMIRRDEQRSAARFAAHITCSDLDSERLVQVLPDIHCVAIPNGVDCDYFTPQDSPPRPASLIFVGTMNWYPNVDAMEYFLSEIWPGLKQRVPSVTMAIAGSNPPESIRTLASSLQDVTVHGYVPDVRPMIDSAALFVCPIRDGGGTKLKILDAFAMKKCVVAHPIACEGIDVTPGRDVALASNPAEFIETIATLLADRARREAMGQAARELVEARYSFRAIGARFSAMMRDIAQARSPLQS
jgi:glycosyltransferase involved in cell wall biosynthesis